MTCIDATDALAPLKDVYTLEQIDDFMCAPQEILNGRTPMGLICEGRMDEVKRLAEQIRDGVHL